MPLASVAFQSPGIGHRRCKVRASAMSYCLDEGLTQSGRPGRDVFAPPWRAYLAGDIIVTRSAVIRCKSLGSERGSNLYQILLLETKTCSKLIGCAKIMKLSREGRCKGVFHPRGRLLFVTVRRAKTSATAVE